MVLAPHEKPAASATSADATTDAAARASDAAAPFVQVAITEPASSPAATTAKTPKRRWRLPFCSAWCDRAMTADTIAGAALRVGFFGVLLVVVAVVYGVSIQRCARHSLERY